MGKEIIYITVSICLLFVVIFGCVLLIQDQANSFEMRCIDKGWTVIASSCIVPFSR